MGSMHVDGTTERLREALRAAPPGKREAIDAVASDVGPLLINPSEARRRLEAHLEPEVVRARITGTLDRRLVLIERRDHEWVAADLSGQPHSTRRWPTWTEGHLDIHAAASWLSSATLTEHATYRLDHPRVLLAALYHPEYFPLPRFPLAISDVARAARATLLGEVTLADMQLGVTVEELIKMVTGEQPDVLGISATFGQHDLMTQVLDAAYGLAEPMLVVAGGSLTARNERILLDRYPDLLIARGAGETTIQDVLAHWHGDLPLEEVHGLGYNGAAHGAGTRNITRRRTAKTPNRIQSDILPELDLLPATFEHHGVAQLEASRGCTNFCSFCPRGHKGQWARAEAEMFPWILREMRTIFDRYPDTSKTLYLVDEEFIGRGPDAVPRAPVVTLMEEAAFSGRPFRIGTVFVHSANPIGAETVVRALTCWNYQVRRVTA